MFYIPAVRRRGRVSICCLLVSPSFLLSNVWKWEPWIPSHLTVSLSLLILGLSGGWQHSYTEYWVEDQILMSAGGGGSAADLCTPLPRRFLQTRLCRSNADVKMGSRTKEQGGRAARRVWPRPWCRPHGSPWRSISTPLLTFEDERSFYICMSVCSKGHGVLIRGRRCERRGSGEEVEGKECSVVLPCTGERISRRVNILWQFSLLWLQFEPPSPVVLGSWTPSQACLSFFFFSSKAASIWIRLQEKWREQNHLKASHLQFHRGTW